MHAKLRKSSEELAPKPKQLALRIEVDLHAKIEAHAARLQATAAAGTTITFADAARNLIMLGLESLSEKKKPKR